ncbi:MAG: FtsX-like permease family protein [Oligoflexus sp.]
MNVTNFISMRYLKSSRENRFFSWITVLSLLGLAIGVAALIVVLSVINGFEHELRKSFLHANAHIMAYRYPAGMSQPERWSKIIQDDFRREVRGISPFIHYETMAKSGSIMHGVLVRGIEPRLREAVQSLDGLIQPTESLQALQKEIDDAKKGQPLPGVPSVILGSGLMSILDLKVGDQFMLISPSYENYSDMKPFRVAGVYNSGLKHYDNRLIAMSLTAAAQFFDMGDVVTGLEIGLHDADNSVAVAAQMEQKYNLSFREWQSYNRPLFEAMERERAVIALIVAMVTVVAGFNILTTIFVSVSQKQKDISILKALGATNRQIVRIFVGQSIYIGIIGSAVGAGLAVLISFLLEKYQFIDLPDPYFLKNLPVHYSMDTYLTICLAAIAVCILASLYPAMIASRVNPTEGLKGTGQALT